MSERFLANVGTALIFKGDDFVGVADTLTENTFSFSATPNEVRGGKSNPLLGRWFSDSTMNVTLTNATFKLEYLAWTLGTTIEQGGTGIYESTGDGEKVVTAGSIELTQKPAAFNGTMIGWYKKPADVAWSIGQITTNGNKYYLGIPNSQINEFYCVKYPYMDENARMITIPADFNPEELHVVILNDEYNADAGSSSRSVVGRLITDIPRLGLDPSQDLTLNATSSAPTQLSGTAFRYNLGGGCTSEAAYGTMTEQVYDAKWQDNVIALAAENVDVSLVANETETAIIRAVFGAGVASKVYDNSYFTFTSSANGTSSVDNKGVIKGVAQGTAYISAQLTGYDKVAPAIIEVEVTA